MTKRILFICLIISGYLNVAQAANPSYVSGVMQVTLRTGPGTSHKVTHMVSSGERITVLEPGKNWSKVRLDSGKVGYMLNRFITPEMPCNITLEKLQTKHQTLVEQSAEPLKEVARLADENERLQTNFAAAEQSLNDLQIEHETLKKESKDFINIKSKYTETSKQLTEKSGKVEKLESDIARLGWNQSIRWFLSGAGVMLLGYLIGFFSKKRRRRSLLL